MTDKLKPPYTSGADLNRLFERMRTLGDPGQIDSKWVENYGLAESQPSGVVTALKWLGVIDKDGKSLGVWDALRVPSSRSETLTRLMREAYSDVFDRVDVGEANRQDLDGAFINAYRVGDPKRLIKCFLALCGHAGIKTKAAQRSSASGGTAKLVAPKIPNGTPKTTAAGTAPSSTTRTQKTRRGSEQIPIALTLSIEIPADWSEDQVRERIESVRRAIQ